MSSCCVERKALVHKTTEIPFIHSHSVSIAIQRLPEQKDWQPVPTADSLAP